MKIEVSPGELMDKLTILAIKLEKIKDGQKRVNIRREYDLLSREMAAAGISAQSPEYHELLAINRRLWDIENQLRAHEAAKNFDERFISLARSVYLENDRRAAVKREINLRLGSDLIEEKQYSAY